MLDIQLLRKDLPAAVAGLKRRGFVFDEAAFRALEDERKQDPVAHRGAAGQAQLALQAGRHAQGQGRGRLRRDGRSGAASATSSSPTKPRSPPCRRSISAFLRVIPNIPRCRGARRPLERARTSRCAAGARRARSISRRRTTSTWAQGLGGLDFDTAAKISGARFSVLKGAARAPASRARAVHARRCTPRSTATPRSTFPTW